MTSSLILLALLTMRSTGVPPAIKPPLIQAAYIPFDGEKSLWHDGFERYDYVMDAQTQAITPFKREDSEGFGIAGPAAGQRRCVVICPKHPAPGNPWSWRGCYWDHQPQTEIELLRRGFHVAYISAGADLKPDKLWDVWYDYLTQKHNLSKKPAFVGMSRGGLFELTWATTHPDRVSGIYADNPAWDDGVFRNFLDLVRQDVPILFVCGTNDPLLVQHALPMEALYQQLGGRASMMLKDGAGHHPHSLSDPKPIADFLESSTQFKAPPVPDFVGDNHFERTSYYSIDNSYAWHPEDGYYLTCRGAAFSDCYDLYRLTMGFETAVTIITPKKEAPGRPWVLRSSHVERNAAVDQVLLARGFHIVVGPIGYGSDGPQLADWNKLYAYLTDHGFSKKAVLEGEGGSAGTVYGWAVEHPDEVACLFAKNPIMHAAGFEKQPMDHLDLLSKSGIKLLHLCDDLTPELMKEEHEMEDKYRGLNGDITTIHSPGASQDTKTAVDFILKHSSPSP